MTYLMMYQQLCEQLKNAGCDSPEFDMYCLLEHFGGISRAGMPLHGGEIVPDTVLQRLEMVVKRRADGQPLQYILGEWDFLSLTLSVGEGVLIPRPDTELLCECVSQRLREIPAPLVLDLCAGSGCVGLGIASLSTGAKVTAVELSDQALPYLQRNCARYPDYDVTPMKADVRKDMDLFHEYYHAIVSNPPYIPSKELPSLMREVQHEPKMALDGGDGLVFYRAIADEWTKKLLPGGFVAVEVGIGQAHDVAALFEAAGLHDIDIHRDYGGIERVVIGKY